MNNSLVRKWWTANRITICYSIFIMIAGTLLHFAYEWSGENAFVALFSPVSESVWEHLKLFFVPAFFYTLFLYYLVGEECPDYLWCQAKSILAGMLFIVIVFFTYTGIMKRNYSVMDIGSFYLAAVISGFVTAKCQKNLPVRTKWRGREQGDSRKGKGKEDSGIKRYAGVVLLVLWALFIWFSYHLPEPLVQWFPGLFIEY